MITFERIQEKDILQAKVVLKKVWSDTYTVYTPEQIEKITSVWHDPLELKKEAKDPNYFFGVAKDEDRVVGVVTAKKDDEVIKVPRLYVLKQYHGQGIGKSLLSRAMSAFPECAICELGVEDDNLTAMGFYFKQGFVDTGRIYKETVEGVEVILRIFEKTLSDTKKEA